MSFAMAAGCSPKALRLSAILNWAGVWHSERKRSGRIPTFHFQNTFGEIKHLGVLGFEMRRLGRSKLQYSWFEDDLNDSKSRSTPILCNIGR